MKEKKLLEINQFKSTILTHTGGFLLSTGNENGERNTNVDIGSLFFDSATMTGENWLNFQNKLDKKVVGDKKFSDIYALGNASIYLRNVKVIQEHTGNHLVDQFLVNVQRMFSLELLDKDGDSLWVCIGLM